MQVLQDLFYVLLHAYFTCDRSLTRTVWKRARNAVVFWNNTTLHVGELTVIKSAFLWGDCVCLQAWLRTIYREYRQRTVAIRSRSLVDCTTAVWGWWRTWQECVRDGAALKSTTPPLSALQTFVSQVPYALGVFSWTVYLKGSFLFGPLLHRPVVVSLYPRCFLLLCLCVHI